MTGLFGTRWFMSIIVLLWECPFLFCFETTVKTQAKYFTPRSKPFIATFHYDDKVKLDLNSLFFVPSNTDHSSIESTLMGLGSQNEGYEPDTHITETTFFEEDRLGTTELRKVLLLELSGFKKLFSRYPAKYQDFCLLIWQKSDEPAKTHNLQFCQSLQLRVVNNSLDFTELGSFAHGQSLSMVSAPHNNDMDLQPLTNEMLPKYLNYSLRCNSTDSRGGRPPRASTFHSESNSSAISSREVDDPMFEPFSGTQQVYLDGYIIDYDLEQGYFGLLQSKNSTMKFVSGTNIPGGCVRVSFGSSQGRTKQFVWIFCEKAEELYVLQATVLETFVKVLATSQGEFLPTAEWRNMQVMGAYENCAPFDGQDDLLCRNGKSYLSLIRFTKDPLKLDLYRVIPISHFEEIYAETMEVSKQNFSFELIPTPAFNQLSFVMISISNQTKTLVWIENLDLRLMIEDVKHQDTPTIFQSPPISFDAINTTAACLTTKGVYYYDHQQKGLYFFPKYLGGMLLLKNVSRIRGYLKSTTCYYEEGLWLVNFLEEIPLSDRILVRTMLLDGQASNGLFDATLRVRADLEYYFPYETKVVNQEPFFKPMWIAYYDTESNSLVWHGSDNPDVYSVTQTIRGLRYELRLDRDLVSVSTNDPGNYSCVLVGSQIISVNHSTYEVSFGVEVLELVDVSVRQVRAVEPVVVEKDRNGLVSLDVDVEDYFSISGPIRSVESKIHLKELELADDFGSIAVKPRISHLFTVNVGDPMIGYDHLLAAADDLLVGFKGNEVHIVEKTSDRYFNQKHIIDYYDKIDFFSNQNFDKKRYFERFDSLRILPHIQNGKHQLLIIGLSEIVLSKYFKPEENQILMGCRKMCFILVDLDTFQLSTKPICPTVALDIKFDLEESWRIFHTPSADQEETTYSVSLLLWRNNGERSCFHAIKNYVISNNITRFYEAGGEIPHSHQCRIHSMDTYWNEDDQTYHFNFFIAMNGGTQLQEYWYDDTKGWELVYLQRVRPELFHGGIWRMKCNIRSSRCIIILTTNLMIEFDYSYDKYHKAYSVVWPVNQNFKHHLLNSKNKISKIELGRQFFYLHDSQVGSGIHFYKYGTPQSSYTTVEEHYGADLTTELFPGCPLSQVLEDQCTKEYLMLFNKKISAQAFTLGPLAISLSNIPLSYLTTPLRVSLQLLSAATSLPQNASESTFKPTNPKQASGSYLSNSSNPGKMVLALQFVPKLSKPIRFSDSLGGWALVLGILAAVLSLGLLLNHVGYRLALRDSADPVTDGVHDTDKPYSTYGSIILIN